MAIPLILALVNEMVNRLVGYLEMVLIGYYWWGMWQSHGRWQTRGGPKLENRIYRYKDWS